MVSSCLLFSLSLSQYLVYIQHQLLSWCWHRFGTVRLRWGVGRWWILSSMGIWHECTDMLPFEMSMDTYLHALSTSLYLLCSPFVSSLFPTSKIQVTMTSPVRGKGGPTKSQWLHILQRGGG
jgi:hypothetical protein